MPLSLVSIAGVCAVAVTATWLGRQILTHSLQRRHSPATSFSYLSQPQHVLQYFAVCLILSTIAYSLLGFTVATVSAFIATSLPLVAVPYQAINFHHYVVDAMIWKVRRRPVQQNFGITK